MNTSTDADLLTFEQAINNQIASEQTHGASQRVREEHRKKYEQAATKYEKHRKELMRKQYEMVEKITPLSLHVEVLQKTLKLKKGGSLALFNFEPENLKTLKTIIKEKLTALRIKRRASKGKQQSSKEKRQALEGFDGKLFDKILQLDTKKHHYKNAFFYASEIEFLRLLLARSNEKTLRTKLLKATNKNQEKNIKKVYDELFQQFLNSTCGNYKLKLQRETRKTKEGTPIIRPKEARQGLIDYYAQHTIQPIIFAERRFIKKYSAKSAKALKKRLKEISQKIDCLEEQITQNVEEVGKINREVTDLKLQQETCQNSRKRQLAEQRSRSIHKDIVDGNRAAVRKKLMVDAEFNLVNQFIQGFFPLNLAMQEGRPIIALMILLRGADPSLKDINQMTALDYSHDNPSSASILTQIAIKNSLPNTRFPKNTVNEQSLIEQHFNLQNNDTLCALYTMKLERKLNQLQLRYFKKKSKLSFKAWLKTSYGDSAIAENEVYLDFQKYLTSFAINDGVNEHRVNKNVYLAASKQMQALLNKYAERFCMFNGLNQKPGTINNMKAKTNVLKQTLKQNKTEINRLDSERIKQEKHFDNILHLSKINGLIHTSNIFLTPEQMNQHIQCLEKYSTYRNPKKLRRYLEKLENKHHVSIKTLVKTLPKLITIAAKHHRSRTVKLLACLGWPTTTAPVQSLVNKKTLRSILASACHFFGKKHREVHPESNAKNTITYTFKSKHVT